MQNYLLQKKCKTKNAKLSITKKPKKNKKANKHIHIQ